VVAAVLSAVVPFVSQGEDAANPRGDFVIDAMHGVPRTAVTKDCVRTGMSRAGVSVAECLPAASVRAPAAEQPAPTAAEAVPEPALPDFVREPEPADMKPVPPMEPVAYDDDGISDPMWYYDEEERTSPDLILGRTVNPDYEAELAAAEAEMARSATAQVPPAAAPAPQAPPKKKIVRVTLETGPHFDFNQATLRPSGKEKMDQFLADLQEIDFDTIVVVGHTDRIGTAPANRKLSQRRADAVKQYLASNNVQAGKITAFGAGSTQPVTQSGDCKGLKGRRLIECLQPDRRVEVEASGGQIVRQ
jgi:outer membrane protein OmpA-like peptidoglycan-associated protein